MGKRLEREIGCQIDDAAFNARSATASTPKEHGWPQPARPHWAQGRQRARLRLLAGMKNANVTWSDDTLSKYLAHPKAFIPGDKMVFLGIKDPSKLGDLLAYLNQAAR
jgi:hypothetical protein